MGHREENELRGVCFGLLFSVSNLRATKKASTAAGSWFFYGFFKRQSFALNDFQCLSP